MIIALPTAVLLNIGISFAEIHILFGLPITKTVSVSSTIAAPPIVSSEILTPLPPRPCLGISVNFILLPVPLLEKIANVSSLLCNGSPTTTSSPSPSLIPFTPDVFLPMAAISTVLKWIPIPCFVTRNKSSVSKKVTLAIESPSFILIAIIPVVRLVEVYSSKAVFLIKPFFVINTTYFALVLR